MISFSDRLKTAGLALAMLMPTTMLPVAVHGQQTDTPPAKARSKKKARKSGPPATTPSQAEGTTQRNPQSGTVDPVNPSGSPEPPTPTTQGPPPPPTTPPVNTPQPPQ